MGLYQHCSPRRPGVWLIRLDGERCYAQSLTGCLGRAWLDHICFINVGAGGDRRCLTEARLTEARFTEASSGILCARFRALKPPKRAQDSLRHEKKCLCYHSCLSVRESIFSRTMKHTEPKFSASICVYSCWKQSKFGSFLTMRRG